MPNDSNSSRTLAEARRLVSRELVAEMQNGHWEGELSASALSTATACSVLARYLKQESVKADLWMQSQLDAGLAWLANQQNADGGWGDTDLSHSNISTTLLTIAAFHLAGKNESAESSLAQAWKYVDSQGGLEGLKSRYGKDKTFAVPILANCAIAGIVPWHKVSALPFELACVPQKFYRFVRMPVVSYAIPALVAIGQAKYFADPPRNPISRLTRRFSVKRSLDVLKKMQPQSGGYLEAIPLTCFVAMGLIDSGRDQHQVVTDALRFIRTSFREEGSWPIDTNLATWVTSLSINALTSSEVSKESTSAELDSENPADSILETCDLDWLLNCQYQSVHPFTGSQPGGWGWSDLSGAVPDADDTPGALLAIWKWYRSGRLTQQEESRVIAAANLGVRWLLNLQNRDDGWPTFCKGWGKLPFDRSGTDITAHALRAIAVWKKTLNDRMSDSNFSRSMDRAIQRGVNYLTKTQNADGSWDPLWFGNQDRPDEDNPVYGTSKVLLALLELAWSDGKFDPSRTDTQAMEQGLIWLVENQNTAVSAEKADVIGKAGWGGGPSIKSNLASSESSVEETALALDALLLGHRYFGSQLGRLSDDVELAIQRGLNWLIFAVYAGKQGEAWPIGFYFAKLWYYEKLYPLIYTTATLVRADEFGWSKRIQNGLPEESADSAFPAAN